ncbi:MAG: WYL domain-containing protein [Gammaproteobacteria bacterium]|nr:WYL domain-containing protein [Gammaproteobacteria bacterium]
MNIFDRIFALHRELKHSRQPVSRVMLEKRLECSTATIKRIIQQMRDYLNAPIEYDRDANGYYYATQNEYGPVYELPGLWFNAAEVQAILTLKTLLARLEPGLLSEQLEPLTELLDSSGLIQPDQVGQRLRILAATARPSGEHFHTVASAVVERHRLDIEYAARSTGETTQRQISPQRLTHYRDNWFVDAWCHRSEGLRTFSLDKVIQAQPLEDAAIDVEEADLDKTLGSSYGIFSGEPNAVAEIVVSAKQARWVADEQWHPEQQSEWLDDGRYLLKVPYSQPWELLGDVLRLGAGAEVVAPTELRDLVQTTLSQAVAQYN